MKASFSGRERICRLLDGQAIDRTPVMASFIAWGAEARGVPQHRIHQEPAVNSAILLGLSRELKLDGAYLSSDNWIIHSALGGSVTFPKDDEPMGPRPVLAEWDQLEDLRVPDPHADGRMPFMLAAVRRAVAVNQGELFLEANIDSGPFQMAGILRGAEQWMLDIATEPRKARRLLEFCTRIAITYGVAMARTAVDGIQFGDSTASLVSRAMYARFVKPYQRPVIDAIRQAGAYPFLHVCGNSNHLTAALAASGAACVEIDGPADLHQSLRICRNRTVLRGNVPTMIIRDGTASQVAQAARDCLQTAGERRLILSPGCGVPRGTPIANLRALVNAARRYGPPH